MENERQRNQIHRREKHVDLFFSKKSWEKNSLKKAGKSILSIQKPMEKTYLL